MENKILMKRCICIVLCLFMFVVTWGQKYDNIDFLAGERGINICIDFTDAYILDVDYKGFIEATPTWKEDETMIRHKFISSFQNSIKDTAFPLRIKSGSDTRYTLFLRVFEVTKRGSCVEGQYQFVDKNGNIAFVDEFFAEDGLFGSVPNLMGDAFGALGKKMGKKIGKYDYWRGNKWIETNLATSIKSNIPVSLLIEFSEAVQTDLRRNSFTGKISTSLLEELKTEFMKQYSDLISINTDGQYKGNIRPDFAGDSKYILRIILHDLIGLFTVVLTVDGQEEYFGQYDVRSNNDKEPPFDIIDSLAEDICFNIEL